MKVALVHDFLKEIGGAEIVLMALKEIFPDAPIYTAYKFPQYWGRNKKLMDSWNIRESWAKHLPFLPKFIGYYTLISPLFFQSFDLSEYDVVVISATGGHFPNGVKVGPQTKIITYCHTPPRFLYGFPTATQDRYKWYWRPVSEIANHILRMVDFKLAQRPDVFVANSKNVSNRIRKFYRRESQVIYPPIDVPAYKPVAKKQDYVVIISRIVGSKNIDLAVRSANKYGFKLKIAGAPIGSSGQKIVDSITGPNVEYLGEVDNEAKQSLLANAKGFLALEEHSDFGMSTVEPQAFGTPVVAYRGGGYLETVVENKTGIFFDKLNEQDLALAVAKLDTIKWNNKTLVTNARKFAKEKFQNQMLELVNSYARTSGN